MKRRRYRLGKRADAVAGTRRRIVEATISLHDEQGITGTSVRDVAQRAGVSAATVLNHFPTMGELIQACGELSNQLYPMPTPAVLVGAADPAERLRSAAGALFEWWEGMDRGWDPLQVDRRTLPAVDAWLREVEARHRALVAEALGAEAPPKLVALATALTSMGSWRSMRASGLGSAEAAAEVTRLIVGALPATTTRRRLN